MIIRILFISLVFLLNASSLLARSPAVEPFVEIEVEGPETTSTPSQAGIFYNFETSTHSTTQHSSFSEIGFSTVHLIFLLVLALPIVSWLLVLNHLKTRAYRENETNVQTLSNYKIHKENLGREKEAIKKVS